MSVDHVTENRAGGVATVLTVYGIETMMIRLLRKLKDNVATVLTVYGIETHLPEPG